jgi:hypothetical protein
MKNRDPSSPIWDPGVEGFRAVALGRGLRSI